MDRLAKLTPDRLKDRLKSFKPLQLNRRDSLTQGGSPDHDALFSPEELQLPAIVKERDPGPDAEAARFPTDPLVDDEILEQVETLYFDEKSDPSRYELEKLPPTLDQHVINGDRKRLLAQLNVVTKRVYAKILEKQSSCRGELDQVDLIRMDLGHGLFVCGAARRGLTRARKEFTASSLGILAAFRRRQQAVKLLQDLNIIRTLQKSDERLHELLAEDDFPGAIQLLVECQKVAANFRQFEAVKQLSSKLQDTLEMTEEQLDVALSKVCSTFQAPLYAKVHHAYLLLGKTATSMDQLQMHVATSMHNTAWNVVYGHAVLAATSQIVDGSSNIQVDLSKKPFSDLCGCLAGSSIVPCLVDLCKALWNIMNSYKGILQWHHTEPLNEIEGDVESKLEYQYVRKKLENGRVRIWQDVQTKIRVFVSANDMSDFSIDNFLEFMDTINKVIAVGKDFCNSESETLQESIQMKCWNYFYAYHTSRLEELRMHLENEGFALCPVKRTFKFLQLVEFRHLKESSYGRSPKKSAVPSANLEDVSPFDFCLHAPDDDEDVMVDNSTANGEWDSDDSDSDFVDETPGDPNTEEPRLSGEHSQRKSHSPIVTNTSLMILRLWGNYLRLMMALKPIASNVFQSMTQLLDFYVFVVHHFFTHDIPQEQRLQITSAKLQNLLSRIQSELIYQDDMATPSKLPNSSDASMKDVSDHQRKFLSVPNVAHLEQDEYAELPENVFGLPKRYVAAESAVFLADQFRALADVYNKCLPDDRKEIVQNYDLETVSAIPDLRRPILMSVALRSISSELILQLMSKVAWDIKEVRSQHSNYVEVLLRDFQLLSMRLQEVRRQIHIPIETRKVVMELCVFSASKVFVEGFSNAKRCSNEGRALMQLDYRQFTVKLEKMSELKPLPYQEYVMQYVKAFYIPELDLETWVKQHNEEYTEKQLVSLVNSVAYSNNRTKQKLNNLISELSGRIRR